MASTSELIVAGVACATGAASAVRLVVMARRKLSMPKVFASGTILVTDAGEVVIDEILPKNRVLLVNPEQYITVEFDPNEPPPPPCAGGLPDEVDWELFFQHIHDPLLVKAKKRDQLKLKIEWRVSSARTVVWQILQP